MCGIAGVLGGSEPVGPLIEALGHRGPDGVRIEEVPGGALAHARLSIIDLECGWQPLHAAGSTVIGNGEIYNYKELVEEFGLQPTTGSDFEPLLHLYAREGPAAFDRLRGMYAFCLIGGDGRTWLVRDPFGIKPLYVSETDGGLLFASEPRALPRGAPVPGRIHELLALNYAQSDTPYAGVRRLLPGEVKEVAPAAAAGSSPAERGRGTAEGGGGGGAGRLRAVLGLPPLPEPGGPAPSTAPRSPSPALSGAGEERWVAQLDAVLEDSVRVHQRSDVPYGLFLSGGVDSATIATLMARLNARPVTAYTCGFEAPGARDERAGAERIARALDLDWRETTFTEADFWRILPEAAWALDDPTTDYAALPTWKLAEAARGTLTVVLTGEGGDELFGGYGRYRRALRPKLLGGRPAAPQVEAPFLKDGGEVALQHWREAARPPEGLSKLQRAQWRDIATWLPNDLLLKLDRCLMAHGLEGRTPFLDREVAAFAFPLPDALKVRGRFGKWILRRWLERHCPAAEPWARKQGFTVPVAGWIAPRAADLARTLPEHEGVAQACDPEGVRAVFTDEKLARHRWPVLFYAVWWSIHIGGRERRDALAELLGTA
jgi:asparagine synthase (glutamine-hydrolysing)